MRILVAEDDPISRRLIETTLKKWDYEVVTATDGDKAWQMLQEPDAPRLLVLDWMMPGLDGVEICRRVRNRPSGEYTYVIMLTAKGLRQDILEGLGAGADDYATKPVNLDKLKQRVRAGEQILLSQSRRESPEAQADGPSQDELTGLWNRRSMMRILSRELTRARRDSTSVGVILADVDCLADVNESYGQPVGDEVVRELSRRIGKTVRSYDEVGRLDDGRFLLVLPGCTLAITAYQAERLRIGVALQPVVTAAGDVPVTLSLGVTANSVGGEEPVETLLEQAEAALGRAKRHGRNRVEVSDVGSTVRR